MSVVNPISSDHSCHVEMDVYFAKRAQNDTGHYNGVHNLDPISPGLFLVLFFTRLAIQAISIHVTHISTHTAQCIALLGTMSHEFETIMVPPHTHEINILK